MTAASQSDRVSDQRRLNTSGEKKQDVEKMKSLNESVQELMRPSASFPSSRRSSCISPIFSDSIRLYSSSVRSLVDSENCF